MSEEYLTIAEFSARLKLTPKTIKNKMVSGIFQKGVHYFSSQGFAASDSFKWSAVVPGVRVKVISREFEALTKF